MDQNELATGYLQQVVMILEFWAASAYYLIGAFRDTRYLTHIVSPWQLQCAALEAQVQFSIEYNQYALSIIRRVLRPYQHCFHSAKKKAVQAEQKD